LGQSEITETRIHYSGNRYRAEETLPLMPVSLLPLAIKDIEGGGDESVLGPYPEPEQGQPEGGDQEIPAPSETPYPEPPKEEGSAFWQRLIDLVTRWLARNSQPVSAHEEQAAAQPAPLPALSWGTHTLGIDYTYDPLSRLTAADYDDGAYYHYAYDAAGNRLNELSNTGVMTCTYDLANRLIDVNGAAYSWDDNGNLLTTGVYTYTYNTANRLVGVDGSGITASYAYNGQGDRISQTMGISTTEYTLDLEAGRTQVLLDGENTYLYGNARVAQETGTGIAYYLTDGLGSVRQLADTAGDITLSKNYQPYGEVAFDAGGGSSSNGFTGIIFCHMPPFTQNFTQLDNNIHG
jgi:YD repeat-containing protein